MNIAQIREALLWCVISDRVVHSGFGCEGMAERNHTEMVPGIGRTL